MSYFVDVSGKKRWQIYLIALPIGAFLVLAYIFIDRQMLPSTSFWIALGISGLLLVCSGILFLRPQSLVLIETIFYFFMVLFFPFFAGFNLQNAIPRSTPEYFSEVINGMTLWEVIFFLGAYLAISHKAFKVLLILSFGLIFSVATVNIASIYFSDRWDFVYLFHWGNSLFALTVTYFLIVRIGRLQQFYATTDQLTGIPNRREASNILLSEYERAVRYKTPFSVILLDIDHFKLVNDNFGHPTGDQVLREFAETTCNSLRKTDYLTRWGGEEFLAIFPNMDLAGCSLTAERIRLIISDKVFEKIEHLTVSLGVATYKPGQTLEDILSRVDHALYQAKHKGRNRVIAFDDDSFSGDNG